MKPSALTPRRPAISEFQTIPHYLTAIFQWHKKADAQFSIRRQSAKLRRCSPALITLVLKGERKLTLDRVDAFARVFKLSTEEKNFLTQWVCWGDATPRPRQKGPTEKEPAAKFVSRRKDAKSDFFSNWLNIYVRDACRLKDFRAEPKVIHQLLGGIATVKQIERSLRYLLREGYLRRTLDGKYVENDPFITTTDGQPDKNIPAFHRKALELARRAIAIYPKDRRRQFALIIRLNRSSTDLVKDLVQEFYDKLLLFAEAHENEEEELYQVTINLCPVGGLPPAPKGGT